VRQLLVGVDHPAGYSKAVFLLLIRRVLLVRRWGSGMAAAPVRIHLEPERYDGGIDRSISPDDRTVVVLKLSASELEDIVRVIQRGT